MITTADGGGDFLVLEPGALDLTDRRPFRRGAAAQQDLVEFHPLLVDA